MSRSCAKALPEPRLQTRAPGYVLEVADEELDLGRFQRLVAAGRRRSPTETPATAAELLRRGLGLWRGPALAEFSEPFARHEGARLEEQRAGGAGVAGRGRSRARRSRGRRRGARGPDRPPSVARAAALAADARPVPVGSARRSARRVSGVPAHARRGARDRSARRVEGSRAAHAPAGPVARRSGRAPVARAAPATDGDAPDGRRRGCGTARRSRARARSSRAVARRGACRAAAARVRHGRGWDRQDDRRRGLPERGRRGDGAARRAWPVRPGSGGRRALPPGARSARPALPSAGRRDGPRGALRGVRRPGSRRLPWLVADDELEAIQRRLTGATHERMLRELLEALDEISGRATLALVLEDLHWSDPSTIDLLDAFARRRAAGTSVRARHLPPRRHGRAGAVGARARAGPPCPRALRRGRGRAPSAGRRSTRTLPGGSLRDPAGGAGSSASASARAGSRCSSGLLLDSWFEQGLLGRNGGGADLGLLSDDVPDTVRELIEQLQRQLDPQDARLLGAASVVGKEFSAAAVAAAVDHAEEDVEARCDALARARTLPGDRG